MHRFLSACHASIRSMTVGSPGLDKISIVPGKSDILPKVSSPLAKTHPMNEYTYFSGAKPPLLVVRVFCKKIEHLMPAEASCTVCPYLQVIFRELSSTTPTIHCRKQIIPVGSVKENPGFTLE